VLVRGVNDPAGLMADAGHHLREGLGVDDWAQAGARWRLALDQAGRQDARAAAGTAVDAYGATMDAAAETLLPHDLAGTYQAQRRWLALTVLDDPVAGLTQARDAIADGPKLEAAWAAGRHGEVADRLLLPDASVDAWYAGRQGEALARLALSDRAVDAWQAGDPAELGRVTPELALRFAGAAGTVRGLAGRLRPLVPARGPRIVPPAPPARVVTPARAAPAVAPAPPRPVLTGNFADPFILRADGTWYAYATGNLIDNIQVARSADLLTWSRLPDALPRLPAWGPSFKGKTWAPEVARTPAGYVMYYTGRHAGLDCQCVGTAIARRPGGPFADRGTAPLVTHAERGGAIDPNPFVDVDGQPWLLWKNDGNAVGLPAELWAQQLSDDGLRLTGRPRSGCATICRGKAT
jgi:hypothetical protein